MIRSGRAIWTKFIQLHQQPNLKKLDANGTRKHMTLSLMSISIQTTRMQELKRNKINLDQLQVAAHQIKSNHFLNSSNNNNNNNKALLLQEGLPLAVHKSKASNSHTSL